MQAYYNIFYVLLKRYTHDYWANELAEPLIFQNDSSEYTTGIFNWKVTQWASTPNACRHYHEAHIWQNFAIRFAKYLVLMGMDFNIWTRGFISTGIFDFDIFSEIVGFVFDLYIWECEKFIFGRWHGTGNLLFSMYADIKFKPAYFKCMNELSHLRYMKRIGFASDTGRVRECWHFVTTLDRMSAREVWEYFGSEENEYEMCDLFDLDRETIFRYSFERVSVEKLLRTLEPALLGDWEWLSER